MNGRSHRNHENHVSYLNEGSFASGPLFGTTGQVWFPGKPVMEAARGSAPAGAAASIVIGGMGASAPIIYFLV
jgi:hypothetical protein